MLIRTNKSAYCIALVLLIACIALLQNQYFSRERTYYSWQSADVNGKVEIEMIYVKVPFWSELLEVCDQNASKGMIKNKLIGFVIRSQHNQKNIELRIFLSDLNIPIVNPNRFNVSSKSIIWSLGQHADQFQFELQLPLINDDLELKPAIPSITIFSYDDKSVTPVDYSIKFIR